MNKGAVGKQLKSELEKGYDVVRLSRWAFRILSENIRSLDPSLRDTLESLSSMEDDPQFEISEDQLQELSKILIAEGEKEELFNPIPEIKEKAQKVGKDWLMCSHCQEAWESHSEFAMVRCPNCNSKLHNPDFKST